MGENPTERVREANGVLSSCVEASEIPSSGTGCPSGTDCSDFLGEK